MNDITPSLSYDEIEHALLAVQSPFQQAAEVHGLLCGILCIDPNDAEAHWGRLVLGPEEDGNSIDLLEQLYAETVKQVSEFSFEFSLVLPDDDVDINVRTEALGVWCQGFLTGLQQGHEVLKRNSSSDAMDALQDLTEIAQVSYGDLEATDENEKAYTELVEYVRLAAVMIYHETNTSVDDSLTDIDDDILH